MAKETFKKVVAIHTLRTQNELGEMEDHRTGSIVSVEEKEAARLVRLGAAAWPDLDDEETAARVEASKQTDSGIKDEGGGDGGDDGGEDGGDDGEEEDDGLGDTASDAVSDAASDNGSAADKAASPTKPTGRQKKK